MTPGKVYQEYYSNIDWTGAPASNCIVNSLNLNNNITNSWGAYSENFSSYIIGAIIVPETRTYNFSINIDNGWKIYIDNIQQYYHGWK